MKIIFDIEALVDCCAIYHVGFADVLGMRHSHRGLDEYPLGGGARICGPGCRVS